MSDNKKKSSELSSFLDILSPLRKSTSSINDITQTDTTKTTNDIKKNNEFYDMVNTRIKIEFEFLIDFYFEIKRYNEYLLIYLPI